MPDNTKKVPWGIVTLIAQVLLTFAIYLHTVQVRAEITATLTKYVTKEEQIQTQLAHEKWAGEALKRIEGKTDEIGRRLERIENKL